VQSTLQIDLLMKYAKMIKTWRQSSTL